MYFNRATSGSSCRNKKKKTNPQTLHVLLRIFCSIMTFYIQNIFDQLKVEEEDELITISFSPFQSAAQKEIQTPETNSKFRNLRLFSTDKDDTILSGDGKFESRRSNVRSPRKQKTPRALSPHRQSQQHEPIMSICEFMHVEEGR